MKLLCDFKGKIKIDTSDSDGISVELNACHLVKCKRCEWRAITSGASGGYPLRT